MLPASELFAPDLICTTGGLKVGCAHRAFKIKQHLSTNPCADTVSLRKTGLLRKEVIQPHLPIRLPCYDFTPITDSTFGGGLLTVTQPTSGVPGSHGVTGGVYKARERIHRGMLIRDY